MVEERPVLDAYVALVDYVRAQGWKPVGWRVFHVGPFEVTVNGTPRRTGGLNAYHVLAEHGEGGMILMAPTDGTAIGREGIEAEFIAALRAAVTSGRAEGAEHV